MALHNFSAQKLCKSLNHTRMPINVTANGCTHQIHICLRSSPMLSKVLSRKSIFDKVYDDTWLG